MSHKFLYTLAAGFLAVFAIGVAAVVTINAMSEQSKDDIIMVKQTAAPVRVAPAAFTPAPNQTTTFTPVAPLQPPVQAGVPNTGITVQKSDIDSLADAVKLNDKTGNIGKDVWAKETPVAQNLLKGMCDCDQRNWLVHFVQTGNEAQVGSNEYYKSFQLLTTLRRSNDDLATQQAH